MEWRKIIIKHIKKPYEKTYQKTLTIVVCVVYCTEKLWLELFAKFRRKKERKRGFPMPKIDTGNIVNKESYIFENQAHNEGYILNAIQAEANNRRLNVNIGIQKMKSGGLIMGTKEEVITITCGGFNPVYIITRVFGTYLYVSIVTMAVYDFSKVENLFRTESFSAYWNSCITTLQIALGNLGFQEYTKRYTGI